MKLGVIKEFYFDFLLFIKQKGFFKDIEILIYPFENFNELDIALKNENIDMALTTSSILQEESDINAIVFQKKAFKLFGAQNSIEKMKKLDELLKVGVPQKNTTFKKYFYSFYKSFYGKSEKIQWLQVSDKDLEILFEQNYLDFAIVFEPFTFNLINKRISSLIVHKNNSEIQLVFAYKKNKFGNDKLENFYQSISNIEKAIKNNYLIKNFIDKTSSQYSYLENYSEIFAQNFYINNEYNFVERERINNKENEIINIKNNQIIEYKLNTNISSNEDLLKMLKGEINKIIQYGTKQISECKTGKINEIILLKALVENFINKEKINELKISALKNKNKVLIDDLENRQKTLSDLFMQFRATSENLLIKNIQVEESIKEKDRLIAIISHDLKTPLSGILAVSQQLLDKEFDDEKKQKLSIILESGNTLLQLINNLLENAKEISISKKLDEKVFDLNNLVDSVVANIKEKIKTKPIDFKYNIDDNIPGVLFGDPLKINQILYNLLGNSIKFTNKGYIELKIKLLEKGTDNCKIIIKIEDTGIGISEDKIQHIFEPFVQEDDTIKEKFGGTGLGLSIVKDYIELMGGKIICESKKNEGTLFTIYLSFKIPEKKELLGKIENIHKYIVFEKSSLLILEDNIINQEILKGYLSDYDSLNLTFKTDGEEGLKEVKNNKFDIILSDIMMPKMDGKEFCINFRKFDRETPLIALTAFDRKNEIDELIKIGFNSIILKPYKKEELVDGLSKYIKVKEILDDDKKLLDLAEKAKKSNKIDKFKKLFLTDLKDRYAELKAGLENKDKEKMKFFCHNLKGVAPTLGYSEFVEIAEKASLLYKEDRWDELQQIKSLFFEKIDNIINTL